MLIGLTLALSGGGGGGGASPPAGLLPVHSRIVFFGDGIGATGSAPGMSNFPTWTLFEMQGRLRGTAGWNQHLSGGDMLTTLARAEFTTKQASGDANCIIVLGPAGHNDDVDSIGITPWFARWDALLDYLITNTTLCKIVVTTFIPSNDPDEVAHRETIWAHQLARAGEDGGRVSAVATHIGFDPTIGVDTWDGTHPTQTGAKKIKSLLVPHLNTLVASATQDDILDEITANVTHGLGARLHINPGLTGTGGSKSGTVAPTGNVANSHSVTNLLTDGTSVAVACDNTAGAGPEQEVNISGTPASSSTVRLASSNTAITGSTAGRLVELVGRLRIDDGAGAAPVGVRTFSASMVNEGLLGSNGVHSGVIADLTEAVDFVVRVPGLTSGGAVPMNRQSEEYVRMSVVGMDARMRWTKPMFRYCDTLARVPPLYLGHNLGGNLLARMVAVGVPASIVTNVALGTFTINSATVTTVRPECGVWEGGALTFEHEIHRNGALWVGHQPALAATDDWTGLLTGGDTIDIRVRATNALGTSAWQVTTYTVS